MCWVSSALLAVAGTLADRVAQAVHMRYSHQQYGTRFDCYMQEVCGNCCLFLTECFVCAGCKWLYVHGGNLGLFLGHRRLHCEAVCGVHVCMRNCAVVCSAGM